LDETEKMAKVLCYPNYFLQNLKIKSNDRSSFSGLKKKSLLRKWIKPARPTPRWFLNMLPFFCSTVILQLNIFFRRTSRLTIKNLNWLHNQRYVMKTCQTQKNTMRMDKYEKKCSHHYTSCVSINRVYLTKVIKYSVSIMKMNEK